jgi:hypothetical protein
LNELIAKKPGDLGVEFVDENRGRPRGVSD